MNNAERTGKKIYDSVYLLLLPWIGQPSYFISLYKNYNNLYLINYLLCSETGKWNNKSPFTQAALPLKSQVIRLLRLRAGRVTLPANFSYKTFYKLHGIRQERNYSSFRNCSLCVCSSAFLWIKLTLSLTNPNIYKAFV